MRRSTFRWTIRNWRPIHGQPNLSSSHGLRELPFLHHLSCAQSDSRLLLVVESVLRIDWIQLAYLTVPHKFRHILARLVFGPILGGLSENGLCRLGISTSNARHSLESLLIDLTSITDKPVDVTLEQYIDACEGWRLTCHIDWQLAIDTHEF